MVGHAGAELAGRPAPAPIAGGAGDGPASRTDGYADTIFHGGPVIPINGPAPETEAIAVKGGRIVAVGDRATVLECRRPTTTVIDLAGRALLPGFVEPHAHSVSAASAFDWLDVTPFTTPSFEAALQKLRAAVQAARPGDWVRAFGYDPALIPGPPAITAADLDPFSPNTPIFVANLSGHIAYVNTRALEAAHVTDATPNPPGGGRYLKDSNGHLTGVCEETPSTTGARHSATPFWGPSAPRGSIRPVACCAWASHSRCTATTA
jgi:predicted amidohydrolase YtcJ